MGVAMLVPMLALGLLVGTASAGRVEEMDLGSGAITGGAGVRGGGLHIPSTRLRNGVQMPMMGLGTWEYNTSVTYAASTLALDLGYVHIDTATMYKNQRGVGRAVREWRERTDAKRSDVFITTKIPGGLNYSAAMAALDATLVELDMDYVDLMLVHFPAGWDGKGGRKLRVEGYKALVDFYKAGKARAIGVSHFCKRHILDLKEAGLMLPHVNQVEFHVGMGSAGPNATDDKDFCDANGVLYESFSPLCGPCGTKELITGDLVTGIGKKYGKTGAQVSLKWQVQLGIPVIPKTDEKEHMLENADLFSWTLSDEDMDALSSAASPPATGGGGDGTSGDCKIE